MTIDYTPEELAFMERRTVSVKAPEATPQEEPTVHPLAGRTPGVRSTSRQALKSIQPTLGPKQMEMYRFIRDQCTRPVNDRELVAGLSWSISSVTGRRNELVEMGKVVEAFRDVDPITNKRTIYWRAAEMKS